MSYQDWKDAIWSIAEAPNGPMTGAEKAAKKQRDKDFKEYLRLREIFENNVEDNRETN